MKLFEIGAVFVIASFSLFDSIPCCCQCLSILSHFSHHLSFPLLTSLLHSISIFLFHISIILCHLISLLLLPFQVHLMVESTAAAMAYGLLVVGKKNVMIFDMGGGQFPSICQSVTQSVDLTVLMTTVMTELNYFTSPQQQSCSINRQ